MNRRGRLLVSRVAFAALALAALALAWRVDGRYHRPARPPRADAVAATSDAGAPGPGTPPATAAEAYEIALRLVEAAESARVERTKSPGGAARLVATVALRTTTPPVKPGAVRSGAKPKVGTPKPGPAAKTKEESFDRREALVSPGPSTIRFDVVVPAGAKLSFSEGTLKATQVPTVFAVSVLDQMGAIHSLHEHALPSESGGTWTDRVVDLSELAGQRVELRLTIQSTQPDAVALWGNPVILARSRPRVPYNVLWISVDSLRADALAALHDDAVDKAKRRAKLPPQGALLPKVPGLTPAIDDLASRGVRFTNAYSAATSASAGTLAMLAGARPSELGLGQALPLPTAQQAARFYAADPPLFPLLVRRRGVATCALTSGELVAPATPVGLDLGFERVVEHHYRTRDTAEIAEAGTAWLRDKGDARFFLFVNLGSPRPPYDPPKTLVERVPPPPAGPRDPAARLYLAEVAKDDEAIGKLVRTLDEAGLRERTIVVLTADHGATLSPLHKDTADHYDETTRVPIVIVAPGLPAGAEVAARTRTIDIVPTLLELLGIEGHPRTSGKSLVGLAQGRAEPDERIVVTEGRGSRAILHERHRLVVSEGATAKTSLFDLLDDPGERADLAAQRPDVVAEMKARLEAALANVPVAGSAAATADPAADAGSPVVRLRLVSAGQTRRVSGSIVIGDAKRKAKAFEVVPIEIGRDALHINGTRVELAFATAASAAVGVDIVVDPPGVPVTWELFVDDQPLSPESVFGGPYGLSAPTLRLGIATDEARAVARATSLPPIDPRRDAGLFVIRATGRP